MLKNPNIYYKPIGGINNDKGFKLYEAEREAHFLKDSSFYLKLKENLFPEEDQLDASNDLLLKRIAYIRETPKYQIILKFIFGGTSDFENLKLYQKHLDRLKYIDRDIIFLDFNTRKEEDVFFVDKSGTESLLLEDIDTIQKFPFKSQFGLEFKSKDKIQLINFDFKEAGTKLTEIIKNTPTKKPYKEFVKAMSMALQPLVQVLSCIEAESGIKQTYKKPWEDFETFKMYLEPSVVQKIEENYVTEKKQEVKIEDMKSLIGVRVGGLQELQQRYADRLPPNIDFSDILGEYALQYLLDLPATYGALEMAANDLSFKLADLIRSPKVNFLFAQFVARKWISPKQVGFVSGVVGNQRQFRVSTGLQTSMANEKWLMGCKKVFKEQVYLSRHPQYEQKWALIKKLIDPLRLEDIPESTDDFDIWIDLEIQKDSSLRRVKEKRDAIFKQRMKLRALELLGLPSVLKIIEN
jgi:hypothetical protein